MHTLPVLVVTAEYHPPREKDEFDAGKSTAVTLPLPQPGPLDPASEASTKETE
jgi:hypothetical protein